MNITEVRQLPVREKIQLMEILWQDLRAASETAPVPKAHRQLLDARRQAVEAGTEAVLDWDEVKDDLRSRE
jgi:putative addiction module component (TIGR02574 family)